MTTREKHDPSSQGYTNAILEDIDDKFQTVLEATAPIPKIQKDISKLQDKVQQMEPKLDATYNQVGSMGKKMDIWEDHIILIPAIFEEVGTLRKDVEILKEAMKLLDRHDERLDNIEQRLTTVEQRVQ